METFQKMEDTMFALVGEIVQQRDAQGRPEIFRPGPPGALEKRHPYADGPFGRFKIEKVPGTAGVFAIFVDGAPVYLGETGDIQRLSGAGGFGAIGPGKLGERGPRTFCRLNNLMFDAAKKGSSLHLFLHMVADRTQRIKLRNRLIASITPIWNQRRSDCV